LLRELVNRIKSNLGSVGASQSGLSLISAAGENFVGSEESCGQNANKWESPSPGNEDRTLNI